MSKSGLSSLPSVDELLRRQMAAELVAQYGRPVTLDAIRQVLENARGNYQSGENTVPDSEQLLYQAQLIIEEWTNPSLQPVINATGVILHTNLGRSPLSEETINAMQAVARSYSSLEYDLDKGKRGSRYVHAESLLKRLTGAEAGLVVNNNASALLLILSALAKRRRVLISRSQLVEIGGGFRIPEIMVQSGAKLVEIGATNKVHISDYEKAIEEQPIKMVMRVHRSNFQIVGFTAEPQLEEIVAVAHQANLPVVDDLGSGTFMDTTRYGLAHEPTVQESLAQGADIVCFSGDKLLGGPQAGIIVGKAKLIDKLRKHPMARAIRADKVALAGLSATLLHYVKDEAERKVPIWQMISTPPQLIQGRVKKWIKSLGEGMILEGESAIGGGSLPGEKIPTYLLALDVKQPDKFLNVLRAAQPAIIARVQDNLVVLDPRTVLPDQEGSLLVGLKNALGVHGN